MLSPFATALLSASLLSQAPGQGSTPPAGTQPAPLVQLGPTQPPASAAFGLRVNWGLACIEDQPPAKTLQPPAIPTVRGRLPERFDPWRFDAPTWVAEARASGAGFLVLEARDALGFGLWDLPDTTFDAPGSAAAADLLAPVTHACAAARMPLALADAGPQPGPALPVDRASAGTVNAPGRPLPATLRSLLADLLASRSRGEQPLYHLSPQPDGVWKGADRRVLEQLGAWMGTYGEAVIGSSPSPLRHAPGAWITWAARDQNSVLFAGLESPASGELRIPRIGNRALGAGFLGAESEVQLRADGLDLVLSWDASAPAGPYPVLAVELEGFPIPLEAPGLEAAATEFVFRREVRLRAPAPRVSVHYTLDGSEPAPTSPRAEQPIVLERSVELRAASFLDGHPVSAAISQRFERVRPLPAVALRGTRPGLQVEVWGAGAPSLEVLGGPNAPPPARTVGAARAAIPAAAQGSRRFIGFVRIPRAETYTFSVTASGPVRLAVGDTPLLHADRAGTRQGSVSLSPGWHAFELLWENTPETAPHIAVSYAVAGEPFVEIEPEDLVFLR